MILSSASLSVAMMVAVQDEARLSTQPPGLNRETAIRRGVDILLERQEGSEWPYEGVYRVREGGQSVIPLGYRVGGTSIASWALLEAPGWDDDEPRRQAVTKAVAFVLEALQHPSMTADFKLGYDVRGWGHVYALQFLLRLRELGRVPGIVEDELDDAIGALVEVLVASEISGPGGWNYSRRGSPPSPSPFMTAPGLQALMTARRAGETVGVGVLERGLQSLLDARLETGAFQYATRARKTGRGFEAVEGAIGRMPVCEATLLLAGKSKVEGLRAAVLAFFEHWQHLEDRRSQTGTHKPPFQIAPYYFYYAHFYAAQAIELLPEEERSSLRGRLDRRLAQVREQSGGWNDRVFDRSESFGTAMVILALCSPQMPRPAGMLVVVDDDRGPEAP